MPYAKILIAPKTEADVAEFSVDKNDIAPIVANGLAAGETIAVEVYTAADTWMQYKLEGVEIVLSADDNKLGFDVPGRYRLNKPVTASAVGVLRDAS
jgi:hypothetical protein